MKVNKFFIYFIFITSIIFEFSFSYKEIPIKIENTKIDFKKGNILEKIKQKNFEKLKNNKKLNNTNFGNSEGKAYMQSNHIFIGLVKIGSDKQQLRLLLDTGSFNTWVKTKKNSTPSKYLYDPTSSNSSENTSISFENTYGTGSCSGFYFNDYIEYIENETCKHFFGAATEYNFQVDDCDGLIGLCKDYIIEDYYNESFVDTLYISEIIEKNIFSLKFDIDSNGKINNDNGRLIFGKHEDFSKDGAVTIKLLYAGTVYDAYFWSSKMSEFILDDNNGNTLSSKVNINLIFDTGTNYIILPYDYLGNIADSLDNFGCYIGSYYGSSEEYVLVCKKDKLPSYKFVINGNIFTFPTTYQFSYYELSASYCILPILFEKSSDVVFVIGSTFYPLYHTLFDKTKNELTFYPNYETVIEKASLPWWVILLIVLVALVIVLVIVIIVLYVVKTKKKKKKLDNEFKMQNTEFDPEFNIGKETATTPLNEENNFSTPLNQEYNNPEPLNENNNNSEPLIEEKLNEVSSNNDEVK